MNGVCKAMIVLAILCINAVSHAAGDESESFSSEKMISDLNAKVELSKEQWEALKPALREKSDELKKSINDYVEKGYLQMEEMYRQLQGVSEDTEKKLETFLDSEEMQKLRNYLNQLDDDAIKEAKDKMVAELSAVLALTEEQVSKLKPVLEDSMTQLSNLIEKLAEKGSSGWDEFKNQYRTMTDELKRKLQETLDEQQMERFEEYRQEKQDKIEKTFV